MMHILLTGPFTSCRHTAFLSGSQIIHWPFCFIPYALRFFSTWPFYFSTPRFYQIAVLFSPPMTGGLFSCLHLSKCILSSTSFPRILPRLAKPVCKLRTQYFFKSLRYNTGEIPNRSQLCKCSGEASDLC